MSGTRIDYRIMSATVRPVAAGTRYAITIEAIPVGVPPEGPCPTDDSTLLVIEPGDEFSANSVELPAGWYCYILKGTGSVLWQGVTGWGVTIRPPLGFFPDGGNGVAYSSPWTGENIAESWSWTSPTVGGTEDPPLTSLGRDGSSQVWPGVWDGTIGIGHGWGQNTTDDPMTIDAQAYFPYPGYGGSLCVVVSPLGPADYLASLG